VADKPVFCVLGAGHGGMAMAGHLALMGFEVRLYNRSPERLQPVRSIGGIAVSGEVDGFGRIPAATSDAGEAVRGAQILMVVVPANGHRDVAEAIAPHLVDGQVVVLNPGRTFGALEVKQVLAAKGVKADVIVAEAQTLIYASRATNPGQVQVFRIKNSIPVASINAYRIPEVLKLLRPAYPQFVPGDNVFKTSFDNIGAVFHPGLTVLNAGWIEDVAEFQFYVQGCTRSVAQVLERLDAERVAVAAAIGVRAMTARQWLYFAYEAAGKDLFEAMHANPGYRGIMAPSTLGMRYLHEDVPMSLVPMASLGGMLNVPTPTIRAIIDVAGALVGRDYWQEGRTVERLGIAGMSVRDLRLLAIGEEERKA
jgi:opine dehydrogenase